MDNKKPSLRDFPRQLQRIAALILTSDTPISLAEASRLLGLNYNTVKHRIWEYRKKGKDFNELLHKESREKLRENLHRVDRAVVEKAVSGSAKHAEIFYKRVGLWKQEETHVHQHQHLYFSAPLPIQIDLPDDDR